MPEYKFWLVWREGGSSPTRKHKSLYAANQEAVRLLTGEPQGRFYIVESVGFYAAPPAQTVYTPTDEAPPVESTPSGPAL